MWLLSICIERKKDKEWNKQRKEKKRKEKEEREKQRKKEILTDTKKNIETEINFCFNLQRVNVGNKWINVREIKRKMQWRENERQHTDNLGRFFLHVSAHSRWETFF